MSRVWFLDNLARFNKERQAVENLVEQVEWLQNVTWAMEEACLVLLATIQVGDCDYSIKMVYPTHFPAVPPTVYPQDLSQRWSEHQYLRGALCLEWRPDTWHSSLSGADLITSAHSLLKKEKALKKNGELTIPSEHKATLGQNLRFKYLRLLAQSELCPLVNLISAEEAYYFDFSLNSPAESFIVFILNITKQDDCIVWQDRSLPAYIKKPTFRGLICHQTLSKRQIYNLESAKDLLDYIGDIDTKMQSLAKSKKPWTGLLVSDTDGEIHFFLISPSNPIKLWRAETIILESCQENLRLPPWSLIESTPKIGIVGLGSVGSKIAVSLARSNINSFFFVDDDILLPENIYRNQLDWSYVGEHKVNAVKNSIERIIAVSNIETSILNIGGQESSSALEGVLKKIGQCDLIIDATANSSAFNILSYTAQQHQTPMIWGEVFGGGIGIFMARSRPGVEPSPQIMRSVFHDFLKNQESLWPHSQNAPYTYEANNGQIVTATDAEVSVLAGFLTQMTLDILANGTSSHFPHPMYIVGLQEKWCFKAPFHTVPISLNSLENELNIDDTDSEIDESSLRFLEEIISRHFS